MTTIFALVAGYFGLLAVLSFIARPYRLRMRELADALVRAHPTDDLSRDFCNGLLKTAYSVRAAPIRFLLFMAALLVPGARLDQDCDEIEAEHPAFFNDPRVHKLVENYHVSIALVNPVFGILMYLAKFAFRVKAIAYYRGKMINQQKLTDSIGLRMYA